MQISELIQPAYLNLDTSILKLKANESPFLRNYRLAAGKNKEGAQGSNYGQAKKIPSNWQMILLDLPKTGINKCVMFGSQETLNEAYVGVWNSLAQHTIYVLYGNTMTSEIVYQGPELDFTIDPRNFIKEHRVYVRLIYDVYNDVERHLREKILIFTSGYGWQKWINMLSAVATKGYNATLFPYYTLYGPHFDKAEFVDYPVRPPMFAPVVTEMARTDADKGKQNTMLNKSTQFAYRYLLTDGRGTTLSPSSNPFYVVKTSCSSTKTLTRAVDLAFNAGSAHVEHIQVLIRNCGGDWMLYDTIDKFDTSGPNAPEVIGDQYWLRTNPWAAFQFDPATNTIHYLYEGDKQVTVFAKNDADDFQNDVPIESYALTPAGDSLLWCNNLYDYDNLPTEQLNKFDFTVVPPSDPGQCTIKNSKITLYAYIGRDANVCQVAWQNGADPLVRFGGLTPGKDAFSESFTHLRFDIDESNLFGLNFGANQNFICYLAGTPYTAEGVQYLVSPQGNLTKVGVLDATNNANLAMIINEYNNGGYFVQKFEFNVPQGKYIARLARHDALLTSDYETSSTYVMGLLDHNAVHIDSGFNRNPVTVFNKEYEIDTTAGDVDLWGKGADLFYVFAPYIFNHPATLNDGLKYRFIEGTIVADNDSLLPYELLNYTPQFSDTDKVRTGRFTDHNGNYFAYAAGGDAGKTEVNFSGYFNCSPDHYLFHTFINQNLAGYFPKQIVAVKDIGIGSSDGNNQISIKGKIINCDSGLGIPSVGVTLTGSKTFFTDSDGSFELLVHEAAPGNRTGRIYFNTGGECVFKSCSCGPVDIIPFASAGIGCIGGQDRDAPTINVSLKILVQTGRGLKTGGRYGIGAGFMDLAGRTTFLQEMVYLDIPTFMETGAFMASKISWKINGPLNLPSFVKYFTIFRTTNRNAQTYLEWVGDKIAFIDNKGNTVVDGNGAIRAKVTIQSLLDFNIQNNFNTNVTYQFTPGDIMRVYDDGNNNLFDPANTDGYMDYQVLGTDYNQTVAGYAQGNVATATQTTITAANGQISTEKSATIPNPNASDDGVSLIIEYDERLLQLKDATGFWIEIIRPKDIASIDLYSEIVGTVPVVNGEPIVTSGTLDTFDTYLQTRFIRIPNALGKSLGHPFESPSISDFWGKDCASDGRKLVKDPQAKQTWYEDDTIRTDEIVNDGRVNGLGRCRSTNRKNFKGQSFGGIVAAHAERNTLLFICERDWVVCEYDMNYVKSNSQGMLLANLDQSLTDPYPKQGSNFGCAYEDTATIIFNDGMAFFADRFHSRVIEIEKGYRNAMNIVGMNIVYGQMIDFHMQSYFINKFNKLFAVNTAAMAQGNDYYLENLVEVIAGLDPQTGQYNLTFRPRRGLSTEPQYFVNDEREVFYDTQETLIFDPDLNKWMTFAGYAPEFYGTLPKAKSGIEMICFAAGAPWFHNSIGKKGEMTFFGVETNQVVDIALNYDDEKVKIFQNLIVSSPEIKYFVDQVRTEDARFFSYIPLSYFTRKEKVWYAPFLRNMGTYPNALKPVASMLIDGNRTFGKVARVRLVSDPNKISEYGELNSIGYRIAGSERSEK